MNPEVLKPTSENNVEAQKAAAERSSELLKSAERSAEQSPDRKSERVESARKEAKEILSKEAGKEKRSGGEPGFSGVQHATKKQREASYKHTMKHIQSEMTAPARTFSKFIHHNVVEKSSEAIGSTIARPNAILAGSLTALVLVSGVYIVAKLFGYRLSGFETIGAFILGWALGLIYDYVRFMALGRRS